MAATQLADVIVPEVFTPYVVEQTAERSALWNSGIIAEDPDVNNKLDSGGEIVKMPFWKDLDNDTQNRGSDVTLSVQSVSSAQDQARLLSRAGVWGAEDLSEELSGDQPMQMIGNRVADWWSRKMEYILIQALEGVFAANVADNSISDVDSSAGDLVLDQTISGSETLGEANLISSENIIDAKQLLGDNKDTITAIAMHSAIQSRLQKLNLIDERPDHEQDLGWGMYMGMSVIVDDDLPVTSSSADNAEYEYATYLFGRGAVGFAETQPKYPTETDRDPNNEEDALFNRRSFILHPRGYKWTESSVAGDFPTNGELATAGNWSRVYERKNVRVVKMITNG